MNIIEMMSKNLEYYRPCENFVRNDWSGVVTWKCPNQVPNWVLTPYCPECNLLNHKHAQKEDYERNVKDHSIRVLVNNHGYYGYQNGFTLFTKALSNGISINEFVNVDGYENGQIEIMSRGDHIKLEYEEIDLETGKVIEKKIINAKRLRLISAKWLDDD